MSSTTAVQNPYLDEFNLLGPGGWKNPGNYKERMRLTVHYAWAIPDQPALDELAKYAPIVEIGAGKGYWGSLLRQMGVDVTLYDHDLTREHAHYMNKEPHFTEVLLGTPDVLRAPSLSEHTLFLCWPPYDEPMAHQALTNYLGDTCIYVGEGAGGCTGDEAFHKQLEHEWDEVNHLWIPQWSCIHDSMRVYKRKP